MSRRIIIIEDSPQVTVSDRTPIQDERLRRAIEAYGYGNGTDRDADYLINWLEKKIKEAFGR